MAQQPLCFVVMPFGVKPDGRGGSVNFDAVYAELLAPAIREAGPRPASGGPGARRRPHPQADVRAADPRRLRGRRSDDRKRQRLLRARRPARRPAVLHRAGQRRRQADALRPRARPSAAYSLTRDGRPSDRAATSKRSSLRSRRRATPRPTAPCSSSSAISPARDRPAQDGRLSRARGVLGRGQAPSRRRTRAGRRRATRRGGVARPRSRTWRPACSSTCCSPIAPPTRGRT